MDDNSFGTFIVSKRIEKNLSARQLALKLNISPNYMCEIEKGKKCFFSDKILEDMKQILCDGYNDEILFYDLIALERGVVSKDILNYIINNDYAKSAIRLACYYCISDVEWANFIQNINELYKKK